MHWHILLSIKVTVVKTLKGTNALIIEIRLLHSKIDCIHKQNLILQCKFDASTTHIDYTKREMNIYPKICAKHFFFYNTAFNF